LLCADNSDYTQSTQYRRVKMLYPLSATFFMYLSMHLAGSYYSVLLYEHGVSETLIALSYSINMVSQLLTVWPSGLLADRFGRLRVTGLGTLVYGVGVLVLGLVPCNVTAILTAVLCGIGTSLMAPFEAWLADAYRDELERILTAFRAIYFASGAIGGVAALIVSRVSTNYVFLFSAVFSQLALVLLIALPEIKELKSLEIAFKAFKNILKDRAFCLILLYSSALSGPLVLFYALWSIVLVEKGLSKDLIGLMYALLLLSAAMGSVATRRLLEYADYVKLLVALSILLGSLFIASNIAKNIIIVLTLFLLLEFVLGALTTALSYARNIVVPPSLRASSLSLIDLASSLTALVLVPAIVQAFPEIKLAIAGILTILSAVFLVILHNKSQVLP